MKVEIVWLHYIEKSSKKLNWIKGGCSFGDIENTDGEESLTVKVLEHIYMDIWKILRSRRREGASNIDEKKRPGKQKKNQEHGSQQQNWHWKIKTEDRKVTTHNQVLGWVLLFHATSKCWSSPGPQISLYSAP